MSYKKLDLDKIVLNFGTASWQKLRNAINLETGFVFRNNFDHEFLFLSNFGYKRIQEGFSYKNYVFATRIETKSGETLSFEKLKFDEENVSFYVDDKKVQISSLVGFFECPSCMKEYKVEFNPSRCNRMTSICRRCQKSILHKCDDVQNNYTKSMLQKHGKTHPLKIEKVRAKMQSTMIERYGVPFSMQSEKLRKNHEKSMILSHGRKNFFCDINPMIEFGFSIRTRDWTSSLEKEIADFVLTIDSDAFCYKTKRYVIQHNKQCFIPDVFVQSKNIIIEFYGDYWHANPKTYSHGKLFLNNQTMTQIHENDKLRCETILKIMPQLKIEIIWEHDWKNDQDGVKERLRTLLCSE